MKKVTNKEVKVYVRNLVSLVSKHYNDELLSCGFYIDKCELKMFCDFKVNGVSSSSLFNCNVVYIVYFTDAIKDYFSSQFSKYTLNDLDDIFHYRINNMIDKFNENLF
ncbi:hypothetical protein QMM12_19150 [Clostridioides difficile]|nr:hypothetical protein [Clostridioides difficile]MDI7814667.1 hypothetical protein [Clostridioides difficile]HBF3832766.1 hypothetical protein [Clostridioides difficile]HBF4836760.1 hypothetical protein [Clostridioides difficile]